MELEEGSTAIVLLAWGRRLGLRVGTLAAARERLVKCDDGATVLQFVRLWGGAPNSGARRDGFTRKREATVSN
ncbi:MAG: hypothetical protein M3021_09875 [Actinomycetota bacterium]|nr:hypothetical protein [Actinomycetota bacterium]